jgi:small subunit ribosomal protein S9
LFKKKKFFIKTKNSFIIKTVGRRKSATAQIQLKKGTGNFFINGKSANLYMQDNRSFLLAIQAPLELLGLQKTFQISVHVEGGGLAGQTEAIRLGIARALCFFDNTYRTNIKKKGFLTRDSRIKERKKYGLKKARKAPQFSKR